MNEEKNYKEIIDKAADTIADHDQAEQEQQKKDDIVVLSGGLVLSENKPKPEQLIEEQMPDSVELNFQAPQDVRLRVSTPVATTTRVQGTSRGKKKLRTTVKKARISGQEMIAMEGQKRKKSKKRSKGRISEDQLRERETQNIQAQTQEPPQQEESETKQKSPARRILGRTAKIAGVSGGIGGILTMFSGGAAAETLVALIHLV